MLENTSLTDKALADMRDRLQAVPARRRWRVAIEALEIAEDVPCRRLPGLPCDPGRGGKDRLAR